MEIPLIKNRKFVIIIIYCCKGGCDLTFGEICERLRKANIENARGEAELLISQLCGEFSENRDYADEKLGDAVKRRCEGYPLQYILGKWWFARCELEVNESCLVPRPDTEAVVEEAVRLMPEGAVFADLCTGSGCIAISLCDLRRDVNGFAVELFPKTLETARRNAERNGVAERICFVLADVLLGECLGEGKYDAIISNPPYIRSDVIDTLSQEVRCEPRAALDGGEDGLIFYRAIVEKYRKNLKENGCFIFEIGYDQAEDIRRIAESGDFSCEIKKDLGGCDRVAVLKRV